MMTSSERKATIDYLHNVIAKMEDRPDADQLRENIDRLKAEVKRLEAALQGSTTQ
jgi:polyhydroxyalkanoate synthesis regulator phasin